MKKLFKNKLFNAVMFLTWLFVVLTLLSSGAPWTGMIAFTIGCIIITQLNSSLFEEEKKELKLVEEIDFKDIKVRIYYDPYAKEGHFTCAWRMRNPDSCYQGIAYMSYQDMKITYPEDAVIPEQTDRDREILPRFIVAGKKKITKKFRDSIKKYLESEYIKRNQNK